MKVLLLLAIVAALFVPHCSSESLERARERRMQEREQREISWLKQLREKDARILQQQRPRKPSLKATNPGDVEAVEALYNATGGPNWSNNTGWLKGDPCQNLWFGLYCSEDGRILEINIVDNQLNGHIPEELTKATMLQVLRLYSNLISGTLPAALFQMKALQILDLDSNQIHGTLPETISMPNLTQLSLYINQLEGYLPTGWETPNLQILELSSNKFSGPLPPGIGQLKKLQNLTLSRNQLTGSYPSTFGQLSSLLQLWLFINNFDPSPLPSSWSGMTQLSNVEMDTLKGELPTWIGDSWRQLTILILVNGDLTGELPTSLCNLAQLQSLRLFNNSLSQQIPTCICELRALQDLELSDNTFIGPIPSCIGDIQELSSLYFSRNNLSGILPDSLGDLKQLQLMDVSTNMLYGTVPSTLNGLATEIVELSLCYNKFSQIEDGLQDLFNRIEDYSCELYSNPWTCPLPSYVPKKCGAECSQCNTAENHASCSACTKDQNCGWCNEGPNCLEGTASGPDSIYRCEPADWSYGSDSGCP